MFDLSFSSQYNKNNTTQIKEKVQQSEQFNGKKFENIGQIAPKTELWATLKMYLFEKEKPSSPSAPIEVLPITKAQLIELQQNHQQEGLLFFRLGHSTLLILLDGEFWLTDPVFSKRASPFQFIGPKRFHETPIDIKDLPNIKGVILSHNHYDHLDKVAIKQLNNKVEHFYTPLGVGEDLVKWGVNRDKISQLDWWESVEVNGVSLTATPSQHFSGRALSDGNKTLWSSWAVKGKQGSFFFSGDSGYFDKFKEIGDRLGPFDISFMETGAYNRMWSEIHMYPAQSAQAHLDVKAKYMAPIHNGTFDLSLHTWTDPFEQISEVAKQKNIHLITPKMGEVTKLSELENKTFKQWWANSK
ncbi:MAG: MBL fold metallo-hydrolase [Saccharospirillaceae bacterium]|nr:MBL fold metallo-hydrolase [Pseudomonadales bacterium]NRB81125.1 MBL fold metallo-hydrolase [Saccharospirillaceae bacterium]